jgi:flagellar protein FliS
MTQSSFHHRANQAYRTAAVAVPSLKAVVMLLDGAIMYLHRMLEAQESKRFEEGHGHLMKATAILRGLSQHLNFSSGGALPEKLFKTYDSLILTCHRCYGQRDQRENFSRIIKSLGEMRDAWQYVDTTAAKVAPARKQSA